jgi:xylulose-5-phosphate/fructose-6-phosphate phosphoketolase
VRFVNISSLTGTGFSLNAKKTMAKESLETLFTSDKDIIINFHGYPEVMKQLVFGHSIANRIHIVGYVENGSTTTPFDMQVRNKTSRYHVALQALQHGAKHNTKVAQNLEKYIQHFQKTLDFHAKFIIEHGDDMDEIKNWHSRYSI